MKDYSECSGIHPKFRRIILFVLGLVFGLHLEALHNLREIELAARSPAQIKADQERADRESKEARDFVWFLLMNAGS